MAYVVILAGNKAFDIKFPSWQHDGMSKLRDIRRSIGLSQEQLAQLVGTTKSTISRIEGGIRMPSLSLAAKLSRETKIPLSDFIATPAQPERVAAS